MQALIFTIIPIYALLAACGGGSSGDAATAEATPVQAEVASTPTIAVEFTATPNSITQDPYASFSFSSDGTENFECRLDDDAFARCQSPHMAFPLSPGEHRFAVRAAEENSDDAAIERTWQVRSIFPGDAASDAHPDLIATSVQPSQADPASWRGILRINCDFAHSSYDDPIVFPGEKDAAHLHRFYGNTLVDEKSDLESLFTSGDSSCQGNTLNRSAYWVPALLAPAYDELTGQRSFDEHGEPAWVVVPAVVGNDDVAHEIFYYSAGIDDLDAIEPIPLGLKMIAGNHLAVPGDEQDTSIVRWHCQSWESSDGANPRWSTSIPECVAPDRVRMDIFFPSCWNGLDLDSYDHKSHLAYPVSSGGPNGTVCPATHPVPILRVSFHYAYGVRPEVADPQTRSSRGWRLASDSYDEATAGPGGISLHGDWFNAWHPEALEAILETCVRGGLDCHDGNLANGYRLSGTRPGTQAEPEIHMSGRGPDHH